MRVRGAVRLAVAAIALSAAGALLGSCKRADVRVRPVASLADTTAAGRAFEHILVAWVRNEPGERPQLRHDLDAFVTSFPTDGLAPLARVYLILSLMDPIADWAQAERRLESMIPPLPGSARDLFLIAQAKLLRYHHQPDAAFELLRPIVGKMVDSRARALLQEELTFDALEAREPYEAIAYMDAWLRGATEEDREPSEAKVAVALGAVPEAALRGSLQAMRESARAGQSHGYGIAIERLVAERLAQIAMERGDATLARWLLDPEAGGVPLPEEVTATLGRLATSRRGIGSVAGRTVGLVLPTSSDELRDEAADVLRGVLWALEIARDNSSHDVPIRLVTRDDGGDPARLRESLEEVAGEGASVIITALDARAAQDALEWGTASSLAVIVLAEPAKRGPVIAATSGFSVGEDWTSELAALAGNLSVSRPASQIAMIADAEAAASLVDAMSGPDKLEPAPFSCDAPLPSAGESRFPLESWERDGVQRWIVAGSTSCAEDLFRGLARHARRGVIGLSLEAAETRARPTAGFRLVTAAAGVVPVDVANADDPRVADVRAMVKRTGAPPAWWAALGHDAAVLAKASIITLPLDTTADPVEISRRHLATHQALLDAKAPLWTSEQSGFDARRSLPRVIRVVELSR
jgi:hypothetical protein